MMKNERLGYIDIAKGLLIILVVYGHFYYICVNVLHINDSYFLQLKNYNSLFTSFYMPAFFLLTGYCSNFKKDPYKFLWDNFSKIIIPGIILGFFSEMLQLFVRKATITDISVLDQIHTFILYGTKYWFLSALFLSKIFYYLISNIVRNQKMIFILLLLMLISGFFIFGQKDIVDYWWFKHSLVLTIYLWIGQRLRCYQLFEKQNLLYCVIAFGGLHIAFHYFGMPVPVMYMAKFVDYFWQLPFFLLFSVLGCLCIIGISKLLNVKFLSYMGNNSIVIYIFNVPILLLTEKILVKLLGDINNIPVSLFFLFTTLLISLMLLYTISLLVNKTFLKYILFKF